MGAAVSVRESCWMDRRDLLKLTLQGILVFAVAPGRVLAQNLLGGTRQYSASYGKDSNYFEAISLALQQDLIDLTKDTTIRCDILNIAENIKTGGRNLTLLARIITFGSGVSIDSRGPLPIHNFNPDPKFRATDGHNPGQDGSTGGNGDPGASAGAVTLIASEIRGVVSVNTSGQNGGNAQSGGNGATGSIGSTGPHPGDAGGTGGMGGQGGLAGAPGKGGNGGAIVIATAKPLNKSSMSLAAAPGQPGTPANNGSPGGPGVGGPGGSGDVPGRPNCHPENAY